eukprot:GILI01010577.1.p1 GENE.GILI01010577.1~~GILI01010577.1.p1  ORF type:complete len:946 (-),score=263.87 GILI01010577.1:171-2600(-)
MSLTSNNNALPQQTTATTTVAEQISLKEYALAHLCDMVQARLQQGLSRSLEKLLGEYFANPTISIYSTLRLAPPTSSRSARRRNSAASQQYTAPMPSAAGPLPMVHVPAPVNSLDVSAIVCSQPVIPPSTVISMPPVVLQQIHVAAKRLALLARTIEDKRLAKIQLSHRQQLVLGSSSGTGGATGPAGAAGPATGSQGAPNAKGTAAIDNSADVAQPRTSTALAAAASTPSQLTAATYHLLLDDLIGGGLPQIPGFPAPTTTTQALLAAQSTSALGSRLGAGNLNTSSATVGGGRSTLHNASLIEPMGGVDDLGPVGVSLSPPTSGSIAQTNATHGVLEKLKSSDKEKGFANSTTAAGGGAAGAKAAAAAQQLTAAAEEAANRIAVRLAVEKKLAAVLHAMDANIDVTVSQLVSTNGAVSSSAPTALSTSLLVGSMSDAQFATAVLALTLAEQEMLMADLRSELAMGLVDLAMESAGDGYGRALSLLNARNSEYTLRNAGKSQLAARRGTEAVGAASGVEEDDDPAHQETHGDSKKGDKADAAVSARRALYPNFQLTGSHAALLAGLTNLSGQPSLIITPLQFSSNAVSLVSATSAANYFTESTAAQAYTSASGEANALWSANASATAAVTSKLIVAGGGPVHHQQQRLSLAGAYSGGPSSGQKGAAGGTASNQAQANAGKGGQGAGSKAGISASPLSVGSLTEAVSRRAAQRANGQSTNDSVIYVAEALQLVRTVKCTSGTGGYLSAVSLADSVWAAADSTPPLSLPPQAQPVGYLMPAARAQTDVHEWLSTILQFIKDGQAAASDMY